MKFDKELVLKHKFWFLLLLTLPLSLGSLFLLATAVSGDINRTRTNLENEQKKIKPNGTIRTPADIALVRHQADIEKAKEKVVHAQAYANQDELFTWPKRIEDGYNFHSGLFAQQIKIKRGAGGSETAKDDERLTHGVVTSRGESFIEVQDKEKRKHKFFLSPAVLAKNAVEGDEKVKDVDFAGIHEGDRVAVAFQKGKYFGEPLTDREQADYIDLGVYLSQIDSLLTQVDPMTAKGEGVVQLRMANTGTNWYYKKGELPPGRDDQKFLIYLDKGWQEAGGEISEEAWLAQEDIWIQREIYRLIRLANDYVSKFDGAGGEVKDKVYTFSNPFWELGIKWSGGAKLQLTIKNQKDRRQKLDDLSFRIRFSKTMDPETIAVSGEPLGPHASKLLDINLEGDNPSRKGIYGVEQALTWETAAVKRIDAITIGSLKSDEIAMSHRNYSDNQQSLKNDEFKQGAVVGRKPKKGQFDDRDDFGRGRFGKKGGRRKAVIEQAANQITKHGLIRNRYSEVNPQVARRVPVGVALIVDQDHIDKVETAFNNSKLRFLTTEVSFNRFPGSLRPQLPIDPNAAGGTANQRYLDRPSRPGDPGQPNAGGADDMETNIEMLIYGIVTLYERYPPPLFPATGPGTPLPK